MAIQQINLFNPDFVPRRDLLSARYLGAGLAVVLLVAVAGALAAHFASTGLVAKERQLVLEVDSLRAQTDTLTAQLGMRKVDATLEQQLADRRRLVLARQQVARWLRADGAAGTRGVSEYFRALARQTLEGVWLTGFSIDAQRGNLRIEGRALRGELLPNYLGKLGDEALLKGRAFASVTLESTTAGRGEDGTPDALSFHLETAVPSAGVRR